MTTKPTIAQPEIIHLLSQFFDQPIFDLAPLGTGHIALVFSFRVGDREYVIRFVKDKMAHTLKKEMAVATLLQRSGVPLPPILHQGTLADFRFAIAPRAPGLPLDELKAEQYEQVLPEIITKLDAIHQVDVSGTQGYGVFDETAVGQFSTWPDYLLTVGQEEEAGFYGQWHHLFEDSFLERPLFEKLYTEMQRLFTYLPEERFLIFAKTGNHDGYQWVERGIATKLGIG